jgi:hypothetical protein
MCIYQSFKFTSIATPHFIMFIVFSFLRSLRFAGVNLYQSSLCSDELRKPVSSVFLTSFESTSKRISYLHFRTTLCRIGASTERMFHTKALRWLARPMLVVRVGMSNKLQLICFSLSIIDWRPASPVAQVSMHTSNFTCKANTLG